MVFLAYFQCLLSFWCWRAKCKNLQQSLEVTVPSQAMQATNKTEKISNAFLSETLWCCINTFATLPVEDDSRGRRKNVRGSGNKCPGPGEKILKTNNRTDASADCLGRPWIRDSGENVHYSLHCAVCSVHWKVCSMCSVQWDGIKLKSVKCIEVWKSRMIWSICWQVSSVLVVQCQCILKQYRVAFFHIFEDRAKYILVYYTILCILNHDVC